MHRFFLPNINIADDKIIISDENQINHIKNVLRLKIKDEVTIFDGKGNEYTCIIKDISEQLTLRIKDMRKKMQKEKEIRLSVACAIPKKSKLDDIIDKLTQLGVDKIIPLLTERVIIKLDKNKELSRQQRWKKIALSASQQSQRVRLPEIALAKSLSEVLSDAKEYDLKLIPTLEGQRKSLKSIISESKPKNILVLIGPEGDFSPEEVSLAKKSGCISVSLGALVLRVETAAVAVASFIKLYADH